METQAAGGHTIWFQPHEVYSKQRSTICTPGLGWTSFLNLTRLFTWNGRNVLHSLPWAGRQRASSRGGNLSISCWARSQRVRQGPCATRTPGLAVGEAAGHPRQGTRRRLRQGVSDKTGQAIADTTRQGLPGQGGHLSLAGFLRSRRAWPGALPRERAGSQAAAEPLSVCRGGTVYKESRALGNCLNYMRMCEDRALGSRKPRIHGWGQALLRAREGK